MDEKVIEKFLLAANALLDEDFEKGDAVIIFVTRNAKRECLRALKGGAHAVALSFLLQMKEDKSFYDTVKLATSAYEQPVADDSVVNPTEIGNEK
jgi:hypothetical protein